MDEKKPEDGSVIGSVLYVRTKDGIKPMTMAEVEEWVRKEMPGVLPRH
jgi:hypothetical protein